ncbi:hypothetical protein D9M68_762360 [compost metagenome]
MTGKATTCALVGSISHNSDIALPGQTLRIQSRCLFFDTAIGMGYHNCRIFFRGIVTCRCVNIGGYINPIQLIAYRVNVHFSFLIL